MRNVWPKISRSATRAVVAVLTLVLLGFAVLPTLGVARHARHTNRAAPGRVTVLGYHAIVDLDDDPVLARFSVPPARFAEQLDTLQRRGWTFVDLDAVLDSLRGERDLPDRAVLLTFDDAYTDLLDAACPILEERGIPAVAFAVSDRVGGTNDWDRQCGAQTLDLLSADGLQEAAARGVEIGSHTATHPQLPKVPPAQLESELSGSASQLESLGLPRPRAFAYPYGLWNPRLAKAVSDAGYELAFAVERGCVKACSNRHTLPRTAVHSDDTGRRLHLKLTTAGWPRSPREALRMLTRRSRPEPLPAPQPEADLTRRQVSERGRAYNS